MSFVYNLSFCCGKKCTQLNQTFYHSVMHRNALCFWVRIWSKCCWNSSTERYVRIAIIHSPVHTGAFCGVQLSIQRYAFLMLCDMYYTITRLWFSTVILGCCLQELYDIYSLNSPNMIILQLSNLWPLKLLRIMFVDSVNQRWVWCRI